MSKNDLLKEIVYNTREILRWTRFQNIVSLEVILKKTLTSPNHNRVYELANGDTSLRKISSKAKVPLTTTRRWLKSWYNLGLVDKVNQKYTKLVSLADLNIVIQQEPEK